jgi:GNAT superfamily N-acetyltransferase
LSSNLNKSSKTYGLYEKNEIIGFIAILPQPHPKIKNLRRVHRLVVLPEYQGIGLGVKFLNAIARMYKQKNYDFRITTSAKNLCFALKKNNNWITKFIGRQPNKIGNNNYQGLNKTNSSKRVTMSFKYKF